MPSSVLVALLACLSVSLPADAFRLPGHRALARPLSRRSGLLEVDFGELNGESCRIGIISTRWNPEIIGDLKSGVKQALEECKVKDANIFETEVPGAFELPLAARFLALSGTVDAVVCVGCLIKGDTMHFEYICDTVSSGLMNVGLQTSTPVVFGVLTVMDEEQAKARSTGENNHGLSWGKTAVEMALLRQSALGQGKSMSMSMGFGNATKVKDDVLPGDRSFGF
uniref:6,7-dimethyl-8-ribityllumazine synthase n=1 Tax=Rhizochromulina marina TaxID=1034831 RepID=A0A7S2RMT1_9STRA|mmetsp:Transcript_18516/g.53975  ORF Transcript_18516/g.53975 Transcript_18516/m.53975 type:complete len:225 (+) Transcript_18516:38-712(+)